MAKQERYSRAMFNKFVADTQQNKAAARHMLRAEKL